MQNSVGKVLPPMRQCFQKKKTRGSLSPFTPYGFLGRGCGGNHSLAPKEWFPPQTFVLSQNNLQDSLDPDAASYRILIPEGRESRENGA